MRLSLCAHFLSPAPFLPVAKANHKDHQLLVTQLANNPVITDSIPPEAEQLAFQRLSELPRIIQAGDSLLHSI